jgi:hypothetical protein
VGVKTRLLGRVNRGMRQAPSQFFPQEAGVRANVPELDEADRELDAGGIILADASAMA